MDAFTEQLMDSAPGELVIAIPKREVAPTGRIAEAGRKMVLAEG